jgi:hypothetical protein
MHLSLAQPVPPAKHQLGPSFALSHLLQVPSHFGSGGRREAVLQSSPSDYWPIGSAVKWPITEWQSDLTYCEESNPFALFDIEAKRTPCLV